MKRFLISFDDGAMASIPEEEMPEVSAASRKVVADAKEAGVWIFGAGMLTQRATVVATDGTVTEGLAPEAKPFVGGFSIIEVASREEAHRWAAAIAAACRCSQEVRELLYDPES
ncbi:YciI family protein [Glycomyces sp. YM15]|uniref:YciI family protein n=1 Tax=Glycomyces sp. YM15 TaxID=2800446 RepID=UPI0019629272|nr:YciI family protein [Glycomyces sp. YM15]